MSAPDAGPREWSRDAQRALGRVIITIVLWLVR